MNISTQDAHELMHTINEHIDDMRRWQAEVLQGTEIYLFVGLIMMLVSKRGQSASDICAAMPNHLDRLPLEGGERALLATFFDALRERGHSDAEIATIVESMAKLMGVVSRVLIAPMFNSTNDGEQPDLSALQAMTTLVMKQVLSRDKQPRSANSVYITPPCIAAVEQQ